jgi:sugar/nucleoside kinase (ribokinase family)
MKKLCFAAAIALTGLALGGALPASAVVSCDAGRVFDDGRYVSRIQAYADQIAQQLRSQGINTDRVEDWNGCIRAYVTEDGHTSMQYFDPNTYQRLQ